MRAGRLDRLITLQRHGSTLSTAGDPIESWTTIGPPRLSAGVRPASGTEGFSMPQTVAQEFTEFTVHYHAAIASVSPTDRVVYPAFTTAESDVGQAPAGNRQYDIVAVHEIGRREGLRIIAARRPDVGGVIVEAAGAAAGAGV